MVSKQIRGGTKVRKRYNKLISSKNERYVCVRCGKKSVKRVSASVWVCNSCKTMFSGGMYSYRTPAGVEMSRKMAVYKESINKE
ncbi:50S ribosomal protein L37ae [Candidatus Micrarchaeota archaeon]|nr:50S ribosomal protein L37ae [Candidatus Micrarchaeota archaeon]